MSELAWGAAVGVLLTLGLTSSCALTGSVDPVRAEEVAPVRAPAIRTHAARPPTEVDLPALRAEALTPAAAERWSFAASAYLWLAQKRGVIEASNVTIPLDDPDESTGTFLYFEGERGRWGFIADLDLLSSRDQAPGLNGPIKIEEDTVIGEVDATFRPHAESALQFLAGVRILTSSQDIRFPVLPDQSSDFAQFDPVLGAQGSWALDESFMFRLRGDLGGFGLDSDFTYQMLGIFGWEFGQDWMLTGGYRMLGWEFEEDGVRNDLRLAGPFFGIAASF